MRARLTAVRHGLLELHKALLDAERERYERTHGKVTAGKMLQLAFQDPQFAWLRSMSELIVRIDELLDNMRHVTENLKEFTATIKARPYTLIRTSNPPDHNPGGQQ